MLFKHVSFKWNNSLRNTLIGRFLSQEQCRGCLSGIGGGGGLFGTGHCNLLFVKFKQSEMVDKLY